MYVDELKKSSMFIESNDEFRLKDAKDLKILDMFQYVYRDMEITEITEIIPAEGDNPVMYNIGTETAPDLVSRDYLVRELGLKVSGELMLKPFEYKGTETLETFLGNVTCDVYEATEYSHGYTEKVYVSNGVGVKLVFESMDSYDYESVYWSHSDFIVKK